MLLRDELKSMLLTEEAADLNALFARARQVRDQALGNKILLRGLIEYSNRCRKDCYYCGLRVSNNAVERYTMTPKDALNSARKAWSEGYRAFVIQTGERKDQAFVEEIEGLLKSFITEFGPEAEITLSCGEQSLETYQNWREAGALRYLLRIETSSPDLFYRIHPMDPHHRMSERIDALINLKKAGFLVGSGVMIGLPGQTIDDLVDDLLFLKDISIDMAGMGPYLKHLDTPMNSTEESLDFRAKLMLSLKMIAALRILMPHINIAASTALDVLDPMGRVLGFRAGANVLMPNITSKNYSGKYFLYDNKPAIPEAKVLTDHVAKFAEKEGYQITLAPVNQELESLG